MGEILKHPEEFVDGVRVLFLKARRKDGNEKQRTVTRVSLNKDQFWESLFELSSIMRPNERIYGSAGPRDFQAAIRLFEHRQLDARYSDKPILFYERLFDRWVSCLMNPSAQERKYWLWDCDEPGEAEDLCAALRFGKVKFYKYESKTGHHVITSGFDYKRLVIERQHKLRHDNAIMLWGWT